MYSYHRLQYTSNLSDMWYIYNHPDRPPTQPTKTREPALIKRLSALHQRNRNPPNIIKQENHKSNVSQAPKSRELNPKQTSNVPPGSTQFCTSMSQ
jgi:hypothetical protein